MATEQLAPLSIGSLTVLFDISNKCNLRCRMCYFSYDSVFFRKGVYLAPEAFARIAGSVLPFAHTVYLSAGSEPLTSPHFSEILRITARFAPSELKMLTNGLLITPKIAEELIEQRMTQVHVSIDGATRETYEWVRRGGEFAVLKQRLAHLAQRKVARQSRFPLLQFNVTLMKCNLDELCDFVDLAIELGVEQIACRHLMPYEGLEMASQSTSDEPERANARFHEFLEYASRAGVRVTSFPDFYAVDGKPWKPTRSNCDVAPRVPRSPDANTAPPRATLPPVPPIDRERPFGRVDLPRLLESEASNSSELCGWALDLEEVESVEVRRKPTAGEAAEGKSADGTLHVGWAVLRNGSRPDVAAAFPTLPFSYRSGWTCEVSRENLPGTGDLQVSLVVIAHNSRGVSAQLGTREVLFQKGPRARPFLYCKKPFDNVYIDAHANVFPYPDCQTVDPFGSLAKESSFRAIWFGEEFRELRQSIAGRNPPGMCLTCPDFINRNVDRPEYFAERQIEAGFRLPLGFLDAPLERVTTDSEQIEMHGWALSHAGIEHVEILRDAGPDARLAQPTRGEWLLVGRAELATHERPDVALAHPHLPDNLRCGWRFNLRRDMLPPAAATRLRVLAWNKEGRSTPIGSLRVNFSAIPATKAGPS